MAKIRRKILDADKPNANGTIYPKDVLVKAAEKYNNDKDRSEKFGQVRLGDLSSPNDTVYIDKISHKASLEMKDNELFADIEIVDGYPEAIMVQAMIDSGIAEFVPEMQGCVDADGKVSDLKIFSVSCVPKRSDNVQDKS